MLKRNVIKILLVCAVLFAVGALSAVSVSAEIVTVDEVTEDMIVG